MSKTVIHSLLKGTLQSAFRIGSLLVKVNGNYLQVRDSGDAADRGLIASQIRLTTSPTAGYVLTSDASGNGAWAAAPGAGGSGLIVGEVRAFAFASVPALWLACDGSAKSRAAYAALFAVIGINYGSGDGSTTFNLPNALGRMVVGAGAGAGLTTRVLGGWGGEETHLLTKPELPSHYHTMTQIGGSTLIPSAGSGPYSIPARVTTNTTSEGNDQAHNNMPPFFTLTYCIYAGA